MLWQDGCDSGGKFGWLLWLWLCRGLFLQVLAASYSLLHLSSHPPSSNLCLSARKTLASSQTRAPQKSLPKLFAYDPFHWCRYMYVCVLDKLYQNLNRCSSEDFQKYGYIHKAIYKTNDSRYIGFFGRQPDFKRNAIYAFLKTAKNRFYITYFPLMLSVHKQPMTPTI